MHEASLAKCAFDIVTDELTKNNLNKLNSVTLKCGDKAGLVVSQLKDAYEALISNSQFPDSKLFIEIEKDSTVFQVEKIDAD